MTTNSVQVEKLVRKGCQQVSCCGSGFWIIQYNSFINFDFRKRTEAVAFADDLLMAVKADSIREAENVTIIEMNKILIWAKNNKIIFNEQQSKVMVISGRKRKENKNISVYMNNNLLEQVQTN
jgi:hypothetical protein